MATFSARNRSSAHVPAPRQDIWKVVSDPDALAELTPLIRSIHADGDRWCWRLRGISALGVTVAPSFTEQMTFTEGEQIDFRHDPPAGSDERAGAKGTYLLRDGADGGTDLDIDLTVDVDLPLPRSARRLVERVMSSSMDRTGERFAHNLYDRLGLDASTVRISRG